MNPLTRRALFAASAAVATGLGAGLSWQRWRPKASAPGAAEQLWAQTWLTPEGVAAPLAGWRGQPTLVNFWATWCPPCVEEMPMLDAFYARHADRCHILGLAIDQSKAVRAFLQKQPIRYPILIGGMQALPLTKALGNQGGGLPYSVFLDASGAVTGAQVGKLEPEDMATWAQTF